MVERKFRLGTAISLGGMVAAAPLVAACGGSSYDNWAATDGAGGRINLDDVQTAFKDSKSATEFEDKVNRIYEGDGLVLIRSKQDDNGLTLEGWEDLNKNNDIDDTTDDQLFSIVKGNDNEYDMRGHHGNGYYRSHFGAGDFLMTYMLISAISPRGYYYSTPVSRGSTMRNQRTTYRRSGGYSRQVGRNSNFNRKFSGSQYQQARSNVSQNRTTYQQRQRSSGAFKTSSSVSRGRTGSFRSSGRSGGRGGGGGMVVRGQRRF